MLQSVLTKVLLEPIEEKQTTDSGIYLPKAKTPERGRVVSVGEQVTMVKVGQVVVYRKWETMDVEWEKKKYLSVEEKNILAVVEE